LNWDSLVGRWVVLNSFGLAFLAAVDGDRLILGEGAAQTAIPMAIVRSVRPLRAGGEPGATLVASAGADEPMAAASH
jgi:hypothetical protein